MASRTDYKFSHIRFLDNGSMRFKVRFYEGEVDEELEEAEPGVFETITRSRIAIVQRPEEDFASIPDAMVSYEEKDRPRDELGNAAIVIVPIRYTERELVRLMNVVLAEDTTRVPVDERKIRV